MKKRLFMTLIVAAMLVLPFGLVQAYQAMYGPTETVYHDEAKAEDGYFLYAAANGTAYLVDKKGRVCHSWPASGFRLMENGQLLVNSPTFRVLDWNGNVTWEWDPADADLPFSIKAHHDYEPIFDPVTGEMTILFVARRNISYQEAIAAGADPECELAEFDSDGNPNQAAAEVDGVYEVNMNGKIVWYWTFWEHVVQSYNPDGYVTLPDGSTRSTYQAAVEVNPDYLLDQRYRIQDFGRLDLNIDAQFDKGLAPDWNHVNSMSYNPARDEVVVNSREHGEIYVIDHSLTTAAAAGPAGDFVYRWGNPANYGKGLPPTWINNGHEQLWGAHNINWIPQGYQGEGHFLIFENGSKRVGYPTGSSSFEINPYADDVYTSDYVRQEDAGHYDTMVPRGQVGAVEYGYGNLSNQVVWKWSPLEVDQWQHGFYSSHISGTQRCKNGNTILVAGESGNVVEVTPEGEVVWNYIAPIVPVEGGETLAKTVHGPGDIPNLFRGYPIPKDDSRLAGKDLTPGETLTGRLPGSTEDGFQYPEPLTGFGFSKQGAGGSGAAGGGADAGGIGGAY